MRRDLKALTGTLHDLLVIGGGVQGACIAWDAALRGLRVALVERDDFGAATSANSLRIVHGGLRYLARGDLPRMRQSIRERAVMLRIAPGLVEPLPVLIPTGGPGLPHRAALGLALRLTDLLSTIPNRPLPPNRRIPPGRLLSAEECARYCPALRGPVIDGGALWYDARIRLPERLTLAFVRSATVLGAAVANYACAEECIPAGEEVRSVTVSDRCSGDRHEVRARQVVVAAGPWTDAFISRAAGDGFVGGRTPGHALALNLVLGRRVAEGAVGLRSRRSGADDRVGGGARFLFLAPQNGFTLLGTWYGIASEAEIPEALDRGTRMLLDDANQACPGLELGATDVVRRQWGRLPLKAGRERGRPDALAERPRIERHGSRGLRNVVSVEAVKYTTARAVAEQVVDLVAGALGGPVSPCRTGREPLVGGEYVAEAPLTQRLRRAVKEEMVVTLEDLVVRRTSLGEGPDLDPGLLAQAAGIAAEELGWDAARRKAELDSLLRRPA